jgi:predicted MFS family arabinose efflux permease
VRVDVFRSFSSALCREVPYLAMPTLKHLAFLVSLHEMSKSIEEHAQQEPSWAQVLFPSDEVRRYALVIGLGLGFWQQASGSEAAVYYSPEVLEGSGWGGSQLLLGTMAVGAFKLAGEVIAFFLLDVYGRRPLLIISAASSTVCIFFLALSFSLQWSGVVLLSWLCAFMLCFSIGTLSLELCARTFLPRYMLLLTDSLVALQALDP